MIPDIRQCANTRRSVLRLRLAILPAVSAIFLATGAAAQTVNYGALEQLFGESVTTSATGQPQRETEVPAAMEIVTAAQIRRSGAVDIPGTLKQVPGLDVMQWASDDADLGVRGYDQAFSSRLLVLVDGRQVYADHYGYTPWAAVPVELSTIRQIEVVKGPSTALFGANAVSGVINIITYNPLYDDVNTASVTAGTQGAISGSAVTTLQDKGRWAVRLSGGGGFDNDFATPIPAYSGPIGRRQNWREAMDLNGIVQLNANTQFSLDFSHSQTQNNSIDPSYSLSHAKHLTSSAKGELDADTSIGLIQAVAYTNWIAGDITTALGEFDFDNQSTVVQLEDVLRIGADHVVSATFEFRHNEVNTTPFTGGRISYDTPSFSGMWAWTISPSLSWTNAVRFDSLTLGRTGPAPAGYPFPNSAWNNNNLSQWGFNSGLVWKTSPDDTLRLLASRGIQLPNLAQLGSLVAATPLFNTTGTPDLKASAVMNYELDWDRQIGAIGAFLRTALFYQRTTSIISLSGGFIPGPPAYSTPANIGSSNAIGGELSLRGEFLANWHWGASYRFESITDSFIPAAQNGAAFTDFQHVTPQHQIKANIGWTQGAWETDAAAYYQSATQGLVPTPTGTGLTPVKAYFNADARIGYHINSNLTLSVSGQNLLQSQQAQTSGPAIERRVFVNLSAAY
jgi:outer membrane receptor for ferrienterochelin and colicins